VNSIYRCRAKVAFKPARNENLIVFPERQIDSVSVKLKQNIARREKNVGTNSLLYAMSGNECSVTINDPYLDGLAWPALSNIGQVIGGFNAYQNGGTLLPKCGKGEDPDQTPCYPFYDTLDEDKYEDDRGWLIISLYYEIEGIGITSEFQSYFRVTKMTIDHGSKYPQVTMRGEIAFNTEFNQAIPVFLEKGEPIIKQMNDKIFAKSGYKLESVCGEDEDSVSDKSYKNVALSPTQLLKKYSEEKDFMDVYVSPKAENANVIQICNKTDYSCPVSKVFYLGKGLYKQYSINAEYSVNAVERNRSFRKKKSTDPAALPGMDKVREGEFKVSVKNPKLASEWKKLIESKSSSAFSFKEKQFDDLKDYITTDQSATTFKGEGSTTFKITKLEGKTPFANAVDGKAYLGGKVTSADKESGRVVIQSSFTISISAPEESMESYDIYQEYTSLGSVSVKVGDEIEYGTDVGSVQTGDKQTKTRYYIKPGESDASVITIPSKTVRDVLSPTKPLPDKDKKEDAPDSKEEKEDEKPKTIVGWVGYTGKVSPPGPDGAHLHAEISSLSGVGFTFDTSQSISAADLDPYITIGGKKPSQWTTTSGYGPRNGSLHEGVDISGSGILGQPIEITSPNYTVNVRGQDGGYGSYVVLDIGGGKGLLLAHLFQNPPDGQKKSDLVDVKAGGVKDGSVSSGGGSFNEKNSYKLKTEFQGVPRSLEIEPGKTVLSFVTNYDAWINGNKDDTQIDPEVWIPDQYKNWLINETEWKWEKGNLKVIVQAFREPKIGGNLNWELSVPTFAEYLKDYEFANYYDYIRSPSNLCYKTKDTKELSCNKCGKYTSAQRTPGDGTTPSPNDITTEYPPGKFKYTCSNYNGANIQAIADAAHSMGITSKFAIAGIVGNALQESRVDPTAVGDGGNSLGIFQWNTSRKTDLENHAAQIGGDPKSINTQMSWFVKEVTTSYSGMISALNNSTSVNDATLIFEDTYERAGNPQMENRYAFAQEVFNCLEEQ
jgi:hypothetical protein